MESANTTLEQFDRHRTRLSSIAFRMLGSNADADDAVQEAWLRVERANTSEIDNVAAWFTTVTARVCLNMLRSRTRRREDPFDTVTTDPATSRDDAEDEAILADSVSRALLVVLEALDPAERVAFVLHDMFAMPFEEIATIVERTPSAVRQLASRARRRVRARHVDDAAEHNKEHRRVVDAFFAAARGGSLDALVAVLHPDIVLRSRAEASGEVTLTVRGADRVAGRATMFAQPDATLLAVLVDGRTAVLVSLDERPISLMAFTVDGGRITEIDAFVEPSRLARLNVASL